MANRVRSRKVVTLSFAAENTLIHHVNGRFLIELRSPLFCISSMDLDFAPGLLAFDGEVVIVCFDCNP